MAEVADFVQPQSAAIDVVGAVRRYAACGPVLLSSVTRKSQCGLRRGAPML
jgi:hypothetical protein